MLKVNMVCPNAASQTFMFKSADQFGLSNVVTPM